MAYVFLTSKEDRSKYKLSRDETIFVALVVLFWLLNLLNTLFQTEGLEFDNARLALSAMDNPMRWLLMLPIFFLFRRHRLDWRVIAIGLSIGVFITVSIAIYQVYFLGHSRAPGGMNHAISFGEFMVVADLLLWVPMIYAWNTNKKLLSAILLIASLVAFYGSLLSVTRGAWLAYVFLILSFVIYTLKRSMFNKYYLFSKPVLLRITLAFVVFFLVTQTAQYQTIKSRTADTFVQASEGSYDSATGNRLVIYKLALEVGRQFPFGVGPNNFRNGGKAVIIMDAMSHSDVTVKDQNQNILTKENIIALYKQPSLNWRFPYLFLESFNEDGSLRYTSKFKHAHNEWLNVLAENGIAGVILLTLLFALPLKIFWQNLSHKNDLVGMYSYSGILLIVSFAIFGQTQSIFSSHDVLIFFIFFLFLFLAQISRLSNAGDSHESIP
jgi:O-antigen ligase